MRNHTIVDSRIMQACNVLVKTIMGTQSKNKIDDAGVPNNTISRRVPDVTPQKAALQVDELADTTSVIQFMAFVPSGKKKM